MKLFDLKAGDVFRLEDKVRTYIGLVLFNGPDHICWINTACERFNLFFGGPCDHLEVERLDQGRYTPGSMKFPTVTCQRPLP
jgi:hypothetical protein